MNTKLLTGLFLFLAMAFTINTVTAGDEKIHKIAIHVDENDSKLMSMALNNKAVHFENPLTQLSFLHARA